MESLNRAPTRESIVYQSSPTWAVTKYLHKAADLYGFMENTGVPSGIRTPFAAVQARCPTNSRSVGPYGATRGSARIRPFSSASASSLFRARAPSPMKAARSANSLARACV